MERIRLKHARLSLALGAEGSGAPASPEPATWALMLLGFAALGLVGYRRRAARPGRRARPPRKDIHPKLKFFRFIPCKNRNTPYIVPLLGK